MTPSVCFPPAPGVRPGLTVLMLVLLVACGGGGGGSPTDDPDIPGPGGPGNAPPQDISGLRAAAVDLLDDWATGGVAEYAALSAVPTTGSARYDGYLYGDLSDGDDTVLDSLIGTLTLDVDFTATSPAFSGTVRDVVDSRDDPFSGTLTVSGGSLNRDGNPANDATLRDVTVAGTLRNSGGDNLVFGVQLEGDFLGASAEAIGGEAIGRVSVGSASQDFDGGFIVAE